MPVNYQNGKIYTIVNSINDSIYVGSTTQKTLAVRMAQHRSDAKNPSNKTRSWPLYVAMREMGVEHFKMILHHAFACNSKDELECDEYQLLEDYKHRGIPVYNLMSCGKHAESSKLKVSIALTGHIISAVTKAKISIAKTGTIMSDEAKAKMSVSKMGRSGTSCTAFAFGSVCHKTKTNNWSFAWFPVVGIASSKSFSCKKYGFWQAKLLAEAHRRTVYPAWKSDEEHAINSLCDIVMD